jgi:hypothetical protein
MKYRFFFYIQDDRHTVRTKDVDLQSSRFPNPRLDVRSSLGAYAAPRTMEQIRPR